MSSTRTPGIRIDNRTHCLIIDKEHRGIPIYIRLGVTDQDSGERRLSEEVRCVNEMLALRASRHPTFADCAGRYLSAFKGNRTAEVSAWHIRLLLPYIGRLDVHSVHGATPQSFIADRVASGVCATTINRTLEVLRTILVRAARSYRHQDGTPWLRTMPPLITMLEETPRLPCPITWKEQDQLCSRLPARLARMVLFAVNTGRNRAADRCHRGQGFGVRNMATLFGLTLLSHQISGFLGAYLPALRSPSLAAGIHNCSPKADPATIGLGIRWS